MTPFDLYPKESQKLFPLLDVENFDLSFVGGSLLICIPGMINGVDLEIDKALVNLQSLYNKKIKLVITTWNVEECTDTLKKLETKFNNNKDIDVYISVYDYNSQEFKRFFRIFLEEFNINSSTLNLYPATFKRLVAFFSYHKAFKIINDLVKEDTLVFKTRSIFKFNSFTNLQWFYRNINQAVEYRTLFGGIPPTQLLKSKEGRNWLLSYNTASGFINDSQFLIPSKFGKQIFCESTELLARAIANIYKNHLTKFIAEKEFLGNLNKLEMLLLSENVFMNYDGGFLINDLVRSNHGVILSDFNGFIPLLGQTSKRVRHKTYGFKYDKAVVFQ